MRLQTITLALLAAVAAGCGDGGNGNTEDGSITVAITTVGEDLDPDGYSLTLDDGAPRSVEVEGSVVLPDVTAGDHLLRLDGLSSNCLIRGENPVTVTVEAGGSADAEFQVECFLETGTIQVRTFTNGSGGALDGFIVRIGDITRAIDRTGAIGVIVPPGNHEVLLDGITGCTVNDDNPRPVSVDVNEVETVTFVVNC